jgi:hypothetical protein
MIKLKQLLPECKECGRDWNHGHDHEAGMAKNELRDMISNASKIDSMVGESDNLPGWVSAYISLAADYMHSVSEYLAGESSKEEMPSPGYGIEENLSLAQLTGGIPHKLTGTEKYDKITIVEPLPDDVKDRMIRKFKDNGWDAKPNNAGGITAVRHNKR